MNERIRELAEQAGMKPCADMSKFGMNEDMNPYNCQEFMLEKFAELIVKDCINISTKVDKNPYVPDHDQAKKIIREIKQHFGVE